MPNACILSVVKLNVTLKSVVLIQKVLRSILRLKARERERVNVRDRIKRQESREEQDE